MKRFLLFLLLASGMAHTSVTHAGIDGGIEKDPIIARFTGPTASGDNKALTPGTFAEISYSDEGEQSRVIKNLVTLSINEEDQHFLSSDFTATVKVRVYFGNTSTYGTPVQKDLVVNYNRAAGAKYNTKSYFSFDGARFVKVEIVSVTINPGTINGYDLRNLLLLENEIRVTQFFDLANNVAPSNLATDLANTTTDELGIKWNPWSTAQGVTHTQVEWAWVETNMEAYYKSGGTFSSDLLFKYNSTSIDLPAKTTCYSIPKLYDGDNEDGGGKIYYRIRAVNIKENGSRADGPWSSPVAYSFDGHEPSLNWQATTTFAEEGKRKTVIEYFDGSLRPRQTVTKDNDTKTVVTAETLYDGQGRPAIQILPAPGIDNVDQVIRYYSGLNLFNTQIGSSQNPAEIFDLQPINTAYAPTEPLLTNLTGAAKYYSPNNPDKNKGANKFIPDAQGYPYTMTQYTPDGTGRVMAQSGVGPNHQLGSGHETRYYYVNAAQEELDGLFGTEVGNSSHYFKNMVRDANGQMSVSYVDMHGRTIATALAGNSPTSLEALPINNPTINRNLLGTEVNLKKGNSLEAINALAVPVDGTYTFTYTISPDYFETPACQVGNNWNYNFIYDLEIGITDDSGEQTPLIWKFSNNSNVTGQSGFVVTSSPPNGPVVSFNGTTLTIPITLTIGSYTIRKTLTVDETALQGYLDQHTGRAVCITKEELIENIFQSIKGSCDDPNAASLATACATCEASLGTETEFKAAYIANLGIGSGQTISAQLQDEIHAAFIKAQQNCELLCNTTSTNSLETIRQMMLEDMKPFSGQYAMEVDPNTAVSGGWIAPLYYKYDIFSTQTAGSQPFYKYPKKESGSEDFYRDESGVIDGSVYHSTPVTNAALSAITRDQFQQMFKDSWANSLLRYHPEYKKLEFAETYLRPSYEFVDKMNAIESYTAALPYIQASGAKQLPNQDPFYLYATPVGAYMTPMIQKVDSSYLNTGYGNVSMWQMAYGMVKCKNITDPVQRVNCMLSVPTVPPYAGMTADENDLLWQAFKGLYENERRIDVNKFIGVSVSPMVPNADLIAQKYRVHFPESDNQIAQQGNNTGGSGSQGGGWSWWPTTPNTPPVGVSLDPATVNANAYSSQCESYIQRWKAELRPCLESFTTNQTLIETILTEITNGMKAVCIAGSDAANPYGSSNTPPLYSGPAAHSFEEVIHNVFTVRGIPKTALCNPFVIEWPKPYGKSPKMFQALTNVVDSCACANFTTIKSQANAANYNGNSLSSLNSYLQLTYQDTLTSALYSALQSCSSYQQWICDSIQTPKRAYVNDPKPCETLFLPRPAQRSSEPGTAPSTCAEFMEGVAYFYDLKEYYGSEFSGTCPEQFTYAFNEFFGLSTPLTWSQLQTMSTNLCGQSLNICDTATTIVNCMEATNCRWKFIPHYLNTPQPMPEFLKCGFAPETRCVSCKQLSDLTAEFKTYYNGLNNVAPAFNSADLTDAQLESNMLYAKFLNYRTGFQYNWMDYGNAAAGSECDLANYTNNGSANQRVICGSAHPLNDPTGLITQADPCTAIHDQVTAMVNVIWEERFTKAMHDFEARYRLEILDPVKNAESFKVVYSNKEYHYTLYYYDQAGQLVKTVPPAGARPDFTISSLADVKQKRNDGQFKAPDHVMVTQYRYNGLGGVIAQNSPDANTSNFWYDRLGRLVVSQNAEQAAASPNKYSYTLYDDLGRIKEVGEKTQTTLMTQVISQDDLAIKNWILVNGGSRNQITETVYDQAYGADINPPVIVLDELITQENLRNRVSYTITRDVAGAPDAFITGTFYTYDIHGNVNALVQDFKGVAAMNSSNQNRYKLITYDYDLISGKVNMVSYQPDVLTSTGWRISNDKFFHRYKYDASNRLTDVYTSRDKIVWERDAAYKYYKHGSLSRAEYGQQRVQGIDYAYTLQGWIKGVNSTDISASGGSCPEGSALGAVINITDRAQYGQPLVYKAQQEINFEPIFESIPGDNFETLIEAGSSVCVPGQGSSGSAYAQGDMGRDGDPTDLLNDKVGRDAFGFSLNFYNGDYSNITASQTFAAGLHNLPQHNNDGLVMGAQLYNGNIASMLVSIPKLGIPGNGNSGTNPILYGYRYDQLNRIIGMNAYRNDPGNTTPHTFSPLVMDDYRERVSYDPNGNILTYKRNGTTAQPLPGQGTGGSGMDDLNYKYYYTKTDNTRGEYTPGQPVTDPLFDHYTNQLASVRDAIGDNNYTIDIDDQATLNYEYDQIGNLISDKKEHIKNITWTVYGKIASIRKDPAEDGVNSNDINIQYTYDASGNRILKTVSQVSASLLKTTVYVRDASGNVMSVYEKEGTLAIRQTETHLYGSSRIGMTTERSVAVIQGTIESGTGITILSTFTRNEKLFELSNHLGNVLVTISDKKLGHDAGNGTVDYYTADVITATDYAPFGSQLVGRTFRANGTYRYGFNGKENDNEVKGEGSQQDYGMRIYDPRLGRFLSVDPLQKQFPFYTPYQFSGNTPIQATDLDGLEEYHYTLTFDKGGKPQLNYVKTVTEKSFLFFWSYKPLEQKVIEYGGETFKFSAGGYSTSPMSAMGANSFDNLDGWLNGGYQEQQFGQAFYSTYATNLMDAGAFAEGVSTDIAVGKSWAKANANAIEDASPATTTNKQATAANGGNNNASKANTASTSKTTSTGSQAKTMATNKTNSLTSEQIVGQKLKANLGANEAILPKPRIYIGDGSSGKYAQPDFAVYNTKTGQFVKLVDAKDGNATLSRAQQQVNQYGGEFRGSSRATDATPQKVAPNSIQVERTNVAGSSN